MKIELVRKSVTDTERKPYNRLLREIIECSIKNRGFPSYYFHSFLYRQDVEDCHQYITDREIRKLLPLMVNEEMSPFFHNKLLFHQYFSNCEITLPRLLGYNVGRYFASVENRDLLKRYRLDEVVRSLPALTDSGYVFIKPICGGKGKFCYKITVNTPKEEMDEILARLRFANYLFEEGLVQHPAVNEAYPHSVNSLRIKTCILKDGSIHLIAAKYRFGKGRMVVDNASSGGIAVHVNLEDGAFDPHARLAYQDGGSLIRHHPDTGFAFAGFRVPDFQAIKDMTLRAAAHLPYKLAGWDIALTRNGPVLIEGNNRPHISGTEITYGGYKKNPVFRTLMDELDI
ncbi:MAG: sugar-transfer associated ATP-grasp domain-containing protein [Balneolales bacterium]